MFTDTWKQYTSQTQPFLLCCYTHLGDMFRLIFKSSSGPFFKDTDPYYQLLKCIMGSQTLTIFVLKHCIDVSSIRSVTWTEYTAYILKKSITEIIYTYTSKIYKT